MNTSIYESTFQFHHIQLSRFHHTDNSGGSPMYYLALMLQGSARIEAHEQTIEIREGDVFYIPKHLPYHSFWYGEKISFLSFGFLSLEADVSLNFPLQVIPCQEQIKEQLAAVSTEEQKLSCRTLSQFYAVIDQLLPVLKQSRRLSSQERLLQNAKRYIAAHPHDDLEAVAKHCGISKPYLHVLFHKLQKDTPNGYRLKLLSRMGVEYLLTTDKTVEEISDLLHLSSAAHFRRLLKAQTGKTPREIRKERFF